MKAVFLAALLAVSSFGAVADYVAYDEVANNGQQSSIFLRFERAENGCPNSIPTSATPNYWSKGRIIQGVRTEAVCWMKFQGNYHVYQASNLSTRVIPIAKFQQWSDPMPDSPPRQDIVPLEVAVPKPSKEEQENKCAKVGMFHRMAAREKARYTDPKDVLAIDMGNLFAGISLQEKKKIINFIYFGGMTESMNIDQINFTAYTICMENETNFKPLK